MHTETIRLLRMVLSALLAGVTSFGMTLQQSVQVDGSLKKGAVAVAAVTGAIALGHNLQSYLSTPPAATQTPQATP